MPPVSKISFLLFSVPGTCSGDWFSVQPIPFVSAHPQWPAGWRGERGTKLRGSNVQVDEAGAPPCDGLWGATRHAAGRGLHGRLADAQPGRQQRGLCGQHRAVAGAAAHHQHVAVQHPALPVATSAVRFGSRHGRLRGQHREGTQRASRSHRRLREEHACGRCGPRPFGRDAQGLCRLLRQLAKAARPLAQDLHGSRCP